MSDAELLRAAAAVLDRLADKGVKSRGRVPMRDREAFSLQEAADVYCVDYQRLLEDSNRGVLTTFRPPARSGARSWKRVTRKEMERYIRTFRE